LVRVVSKDMRVPADKLLIDSPGDVLQIKTSDFLGQARVHDHLQKEIAQFFFHQFGIIAINGLKHFRSLFHQAARKGTVSLLTVPWATVRRPQFQNDVS